MRDQYKHFIVDEQKMAKPTMPNSPLLAAKTNIKVTDGVMDSDYCIAIDEAENRLHVQNTTYQPISRKTDRKKTCTQWQSNRSGLFRGLDTSFCVPYLIEKGYQVTTIFVDSGGVSEQDK